MTDLKPDLPLDPAHEPVGPDSFPDFDKPFDPAPHAPANDDNPTPANDNQPSRWYAPSGLRQEIWPRGGPIAQWLVTEMTGKALPGQKPLIEQSGVSAYLTRTAGLYAGAALNLAILTAAPKWDVFGGLVCLPSALLTCATVGGLRNQQASWAHYGVHAVLARTKWPNRWIATAASIAALSSHPEAYRREHVLGHHRLKIFTSLEDPDGRFLWDWGFRPGMSARALWRHLALTLVSPRFHLHMVKARLGSALADAPFVHRAGAVLYLTALAAISSALPWWVSLIALWAPLGPLYNASALLHLLTEHRWLSSRKGAHDRDAYMARCAGRFCGEAPQAATGEGLRDAVSKLGWAIKMAFVHLPTRLGIWVGEIPAHDAHHGAGFGHIPPYAPHVAIYARQASIDVGDPAGLATREIWGLRSALEWTFEGLSQSDLAEPDQPG